MTLPSEFVIRGGRVVDGSGRAAFAADVIVTDGRIRLAEAGEASGFESVEVDGLVVSPGFIDTHAHADVEPYLEDEQVHAARIVQGVTTEIVGNCGFSPFLYQRAGMRCWDHSSRSCSGHRRRPSRSSMATERV